jgi:hypothetical protein
VFGQHTHDMIAAWQKSRSYPETGYLTAAENQELLRTASAAVTKFDDDQKKADEAKAKAAAAAPPAGAVAPPAAAAPPVAGGSADGAWIGTYQCGPNGLTAGFNMPVRVVVHGGSGVYMLPVGNPTQPGNHSVALTVNGQNVFIQRTFVAGAGKNAGSQVVTSMTARFEGGTITGNGKESQGGRTCTVILTR